MFHHQGKSRKSKHNLQLATYLSFVAGIVNITGFLSVERLTTNVTGHFAHAIDSYVRFDLYNASQYIAYILCFLLGAIISNSLIELQNRTKQLNKYVYPILLEAIILIGLTISVHFTIIQSTTTIACLLLLAMGLQNAFVTTISNTIVRTTHLTGLFTDLGIELSQLLFRKKRIERQKLWSTVHLRCCILGFFFLGGATAGILYSRLGFETLWIAIGVLFFALLYDGLRKNETSS